MREYKGGHANSVNLLDLMIFIASEKPKDEIDFTAAFDKFCELYWSHTEGLYGTFYNMLVDSYSYKFHAFFAEQNDASQAALLTRSDD